MLREHKDKAMGKRSEIEAKVDFSIIRYAQVWEDADVLLQGLDIQEGDVCVSIASAGDNALAMLAQAPAKVIALDLNPAQLFCLELRVAAYKTLEYEALLELMGSRPSDDRMAHYQRCKKLLSKEASLFWDTRQSDIQRYGIGGLGKFERYFRILRNWLLPLVHSKKTVDKLLSSQSLEDRVAFYEQQWTNLWWRILMRLFFSETIMGRVGRDPSFFKYAEGSFTNHLLKRVQHALSTLDPADNPYLHWILKGRHGTALPYALRYEQFERIRTNLDKLEWHLMSTEYFADYCLKQKLKIHKYNLSDIFEYMSESNYIATLLKLIKASEKGTRLLYWNMMVPRTATDASLKHKLRPHTELMKKLYYQDKAFFYSKVVVEEVL